MGKYVLRKEDEVLSEHNSMNAAVRAMHDFIYSHNYSVGHGEWVIYLTPKDFTIKKEKKLDVHERIDSYEKALGYLQRTSNESRVTCIVLDGDYESVNALNKLTTIAKAWNKEDGFEPDWGDKYQNKYFPMFLFHKYTFGYSVQRACYVNDNNTGLNNNLYFKTPERAEQFGKQFIYLWNKQLVG